MSHTLANRIIFALSLAGIGATLALTISHMGNINLPCTIAHGCAEVDRDQASSGFGIPFLKAIPTAAFGLLMYVAMAALSFKRVITDYVGDQKRIARLQWWIALGGVLVSAWLTYREAYVIHAWCQWCMGSAAIISVIFVTSSLERFGRQPCVRRAAEVEVS